MLNYVFRNRIRCSLPNCVFHSESAFAAESMSSAANQVFAAESMLSTANQVFAAESMSSAAN